jgi:hypothetical protein
VKDGPGVLRGSPQYYGAAKTVARGQRVSLVDSMPFRDDDAVPMTISLEVLKYNYDPEFTDDRFSGVVAEILFGAGNQQQIVRVDWRGALTVVASFVRIVCFIQPDPGDEEGPVLPLSVEASVGVMRGVRAGRRVHFTPIPRLIPGAGTLAFEAPPFATCVSITSPTNAIFASGGGNATQRGDNTVDGWPLMTGPAADYEIAPTTLKGLVRALEIENTSGGSVFAGPVWEIGL